MKSNDAGYVHVKDKARKVSTARPWSSQQFAWQWSNFEIHLPLKPDQSQDNINHFIHEYDTTHSAISFHAKIYKPPSAGQRPQFQREIFTKIREKKEAEKEFNKEGLNWKKFRRLISIL